MIQKLFVLSAALLSVRRDVVSRLHYACAVACTLFCFFLGLSVQLKKVNMRVNALASFGQLANSRSNFIKFKLVIITISVTPTSAAMAKTKLP